MKRDERHIRNLLLFFFDQKKTPYEAYQALKILYPDFAPSLAVCKMWFERFISGNFDL